ncbi:MAG TPA: CHAT domain-containing tetratricopeptide repeat protein [Candidatus Aquilonibacter sp.]|nr:CHAT domain-containing tetratricopeptide repeat protein [Candidatus Aquilonibacter sp.]
MPATATVRGSIVSDELLTRLSKLKSKSAQSRFLSKHPELIHAEVVSRLADSVREHSKADPGTKVTLAQIALMISRKLRDKTAIARSLRAMGNALHLSGKNQPAIRCHTRAYRAFAALGNKSELARTLNASIQPLILTGKYRRAFEAAAEARRTFVTEGNDWRAARVDLNTGNIFQRQGRYAEALQCYVQARDFFRAEPERDPEALAVALHNAATCYVLLSDFSRAQETFQAARRFAEAHKMLVLVGQADYNIASLYYLQGEHSRAIEMLRSTRENCQRIHDQYHAALCQLDLSEIYLELNQGKQAEEMARQAAADFQKLGLAYEAGKSLANLALATWQQGHAEPALELFGKARKLFAREHNRVWCSRIDFYRAVILVEQKQYGEARRLSVTALSVFHRSRIPYSLIKCHLLLAHLFLQKSATASAQRHCDAALKHLRGLELPILSCQAHHIMGRIRVAMACPEDAYRSYGQAQMILEKLRVGLSREELRISFMRDRLAIYEELVELCLNVLPHPRQEEAFEHIEQSKSRALRDLMFNPQSDLKMIPRVHSDSIRKIQNLRNEMQSLSRQYEAEQLGEGKRSPKRAVRIQAEIRKREDELLRVAREVPLPIAESAGLVSTKAVTIDEIRTALSPESTLVEYFRIRDQLVAVVLHRDSFNIVPVGPVARIDDLVTRLHFQLAKFRLAPEYIATFGKSLMQATLRHLRELYESLVQPLRKLFRGDHLVIVPHGALHSIPFQALFDGERYLIDSYRISYAPSATIFTLCQSRSANRTGPALVLGIPDEQAPFVAEEVRKVAAAIPESQLFLGESATAKVLQNRGEHSRLIHIATHGYFRQDNPMFSGVRLGDGILSLYDLYQMKLPAELITLSGCATGLNVVSDGDELLGLLRGLIHAGAQAALLSLWDVQDRTTAEFMVSFYSRLDRCTDKADALRQAALEVRQNYPHPYYWAPFFLVGKVTTG